MAEGGTTRAACGCEAARASPGGVCVRAQVCVRSVSAQSGLRCVCEGLRDLEWFQRGKEPSAAVTSAVCRGYALCSGLRYEGQIGAHIRVRSVWRAVMVHNQF